MDVRGGSLRPQASARWNQAQSPQPGGDPACCPENGPMIGPPRLFFAGVFALRPVSPLFPFAVSFNSLLPRLGAACLVGAAADLGSQNKAVSNVAQPSVKSRCALANDSPALPPFSGC